MNTKQCRCIHNT